MLKDEMLIEAFETLRELYRQKWEQATDVENRDRAWLATNNLRLVKHHLETIVTGGKMAAATISLDDERKKREAKRAT